MLIDWGFYISWTGHTQHVYIQIGCTTNSWSMFKLDVRCERGWRAASRRHAAVGIDPTRTHTVSEPSLISR